MSSAAAAAAAAGEQPPPLLVLFKGHPGVGKSTLSRGLCRALGWPLADKDDARDVLQALPAAAQQLLDRNALSYELMFAFAAAQLRLGLSVVVDCPLARVALYDRAAAIAQEAGAAVAVVECAAQDEAAWRRRLEARGAGQVGDPANHKPGSWAELQLLLEGYDGCWRWSTDGTRVLRHHVVLDPTSGDEQEILRRVVEFVCSVCAEEARPGA